MSQIGYLFQLMFTYPILNALMELYHLLGDFGLSIIVLTCIVYLVTFPFMRQQRKIARAKLALQPQIAEINKIHVNDPLAGAAAQQALYKEHGIPLLPSLLPMIIRGLIFTGLFFALNTVLRNATP